MANQKTPCDVCPLHRDGAPTVIGEHEFSLDTGLEWANDQQFTYWRWLCSCGARGRWQSQSDNAAYHAWLRHCGVGHDYTGEERS